MDRPLADFVRAVSVAQRRQDVATAERVLRNDRCCKQVGLLCCVRPGRIPLLV